MRSASFIELETCRSVRDRTLTPAPQFWSCSKKAPGRRSAARQRLNPFRIPSPFDPDVRGGTLDGTEVFRCKSTFAAPRLSSRRCSLVVAWNRNDPRLLGKQPSKRELSRCHLPLFREFAEQINQRLVRAWDGVAEIRVIELRIFVDLACQKTLTDHAQSAGSRI